MIYLNQFYYFYNHLQNLVIEFIENKIENKIENISLFNGRTNHRLWNHDGGSYYAVLVLHFHLCLVEIFA